MSGSVKASPIAVSLDFSKRSASPRVKRIAVHSTGMRGSPLTVTEKIIRKRGILQGKTKIRVLLAPLHGTKGYVLGWTRTDESGRFVLRTKIPRSLPVGTYRILIGD